MYHCIGAVVQKPAPLLFSFLFVPNVSADQDEWRKPVKNARIVQTISALSDDKNQRNEQAFAKH